MTWCLLVLRNTCINVDLSSRKFCGIRMRAIPQVHKSLIHNMFRDYTLNSLSPSDVIWRHRTGSTKAQVMACCLTAPSHYLNQCWLLISDVSWHSSENNVTVSSQAIILHNNFENDVLKIPATSPRGQWVKPTTTSPRSQWVNTAHHGIFTINHFQYLGEQTGCHFAHIFKCNFFNENCSILIIIWLKHACKSQSTKSPC